MTTTKRQFSLGRRAKVLIWLVAVFGSIGTLLYFEQVAVIYILSTLALVLLLIFVAFADLEKVGVQAQDEAYLTHRPEGVVPDRARVSSSKGKQGPLLQKPLNDNIRSW